MPVIELTPTKVQPWWPPTQTAIRNIRDIGAPHTGLTRLTRPRGQLSIRLLIPQGSRILELDEMADYLGGSW